MMCAAPSRSLQHKRANSDWVMLIGSACFASSGAAKARAMSLVSFSTTPAGVPAGTRVLHEFVAVGLSTRVDEQRVLVRRSVSSLHRVPRQHPRVTSPLDAQRESMGPPGRLWRLLASLS